MCNLSKVGLTLLIIIYSFVISYAAPMEEIRKPKSVDPSCNCECGLSNRQMRVVGGNITKAHEFPWIAGIAKGGEYHCGATLISKRHILTAAHCVNGFDMREMSVTLADHNRQSSDRLSKIIVRGLISIKEHEHFDMASFNNDIAILEMDSPVDFTPSVQPACLPTSESANYAGKIAVVAGWGKTKESGMTSGILRKVSLPVWTQEECKNSDYGQRKITENMFCAGFAAGKQDACHGDSGGPLHLKNEDGVTEIIGLVSWGRGCARPKLPGLYTKITNYLGWVQQAMNGDCLCQPVQQHLRRA